MKNNGRKFFNLRGFAVLTATVSGLGLPITGLIIYLHQRGPIASASRHGWMTVHTYLGILFLVSAITHATLNRRILVNYIRGYAASSGIGREAVCAIVVVAVVLIFAVGQAVR